MKKVKQIGIVGWKTGENSFGSTATYLEYLDLFGRTRIIGPKDTIEDHLDLDLLVLPGGLDVAPSAYSENPGYFTSNSDVMKQHFLDTKLDSFIKAGIPVFGICLGFQMLNVKFGGKLQQNIPSHSNSERFKEHHKIDLVKASGSEEIYRFYTQIFDKPKVTKIPVNSHHHQAVLTREGFLGENLIPLAIDEDKEVIEAFIHNDLPIAGVQFHPEEFNVDISNALILFLLNNGSKKTRSEEAQVELNPSTSIG